MSKFENYNSVSNFYDMGRIPIGAKMFAALLPGYLNKPLTEIHLLDGGCGTGNYSKAFLDCGVGKISCFDASEGMLSKCKEKLAKYIEENRVADVKQCLLPKIPFDDSSFDVVVFVQVLHHVDKTDTGFPNAKASMEEAYRVLKPGGVLMINSCTADQVKFGSWYSNLIPHAMEAYCKKVMPLEDMLLHAESLGFKNAYSVACLWDTFLSDDQYSRKDGPLDDEWRKLDSSWRAAEIENEVESAMKLVQEKINNNTMDDWFETVERKRKATGCSTSVFLQKQVN